MNIFKSQLINHETRDVAEIAGIFTGDGWIESTEAGLYIAGHSTEDKDYYDAYLSPLFSKYFCPVQPKYFTYWQVYGIATYNKEAIRKALELGFQKGKKTYTAKMPYWIQLHEDICVPLHFIRGLFDADGCFWCERSRTITSCLWKRTHLHHPEMCITSCSITLLTQVKDVLDRAGIKSKIRLKSTASFKNNRNNANAYALLIRTREDILKWFDNVGTSNPKHFTKFLFWKKYGHLPSRTNVKDRIAMLSKNSQDINACGL